LIDMGDGPSLLQNCCLNWLGVRPVVRRKTLLKLTGSTKPERSAASPMRVPGFFSSSLA
jgi:hypothetical protein